MSSLVTALYDERGAAEDAARLLQAEVSPAHVSIHDGTPASMEALDTLGLTPDEVRTCHRNLAEGGYLLLAQARTGDSSQPIIAALERAAAGQRPPLGRSAAPPASSLPEGERQAVAEARLPILEEELRIGTREVVRGGARVHTRVEALPIVEQSELLEEFVRVERRPAIRRVSELEMQDAGLMRDRVIEIAQVREEAVVSKEAFVREEVVLTKTTERRVEHIRDTVRRTEVEVEELGSGTSAPASGRA